MAQMITSHEFEQELHIALAHLYDPDYEPSKPLCRIIGCDAEAGALGVQAAVVGVIDDLAPSPETPLDARNRRVHELLHSRFVLRLTHAQVADRLHVSMSTVQRAQRESVHTLARVLWERSRARMPATGDKSTDEERHARAGEAPTSQASDWRSQTQRELDSLRAAAPEATCEVGDVIHGALELTNGLTSELGVRVVVSSVQPGLVAAIHPTILSQILITALERLARQVADGQITLFARLEDGNAKITLTCNIGEESGLSEGDLVGEILAVEEVDVTVCFDGPQVYLWIETPSADIVKVLVVDDNLDMARFFQRCTQGTRYRVIHVAQAEGLMETVEANRPSVIVMDIILPGVDGWRLLMRLRENPATESIPVIICSVVREEALAISLGAKSYLPKPVRPREFIQALDQALAPASEAT